MALDNPDILEFEMEADVFTLRRKKNAVQLVISDQVAAPDVTAKILEDGCLEIMGRNLGKVDQDASGDVAALTQKLQKWFPHGVVKHIEKAEEFDDLNTSGIVVGKFSATWCGPCKMVAPAISKLSLEYPDVTFIHVDEAKCRSLVERENVKAYPTFLFWENGEKVGQKVEGADAAKVEKMIVQLGALKNETTTSSEEILEEDVTLTCERDVFRIEKTSEGASLTVNGKVAFPPGKCPRIELNRESKKVTIGRGGGVFFSGGNIDVNEVADTLEAWFPTHVVHVHATEAEKEFDGIIAKGITCAKFSAEWCGPCKAIAGWYHDISNKLNGEVKFLHIDVDDCKELSQREGVTAMPTFHFYIDGVKQTEKMVRGANKAQVQTNLSELGVNVSML